MDPGPRTPLPGAPRETTFEVALEAAVREVLSFRNSVDAAPVQPPGDRQPLRSAIAAFDFAQPREAEELVRTVGRLLTDWNLHTPSPRYFGLFNPDVVPISVAADTMTAAFNPQLAAYTHSPAANEIEAHLLRFFARLVWPMAEQGAVSGSFTSGGLEANLSAVIVALTHQLPGFADEGAQGSPRMYVSAEAHHSFLKIAHACGMGRTAVRTVPVRQDLRMDLGQLRQMIAQDRQAGRTPCLVVGTAGTTAAGAIDPLPELAELCRRERLWFHVDAAWGGAALLSAKLAPLLAGIEEADSVTVDAHKWLSVPMGAGVFLSRHAESVRRSFGTQTSYMPAPAESPDPYATSLQWSRRFTGLKVFLALANLGVEGYARQIEHQAAMADLLAARLLDLGWEVVHHSPLAVVCFRHPSIQACDIARRLHKRRRAWISETSLSGRGSVLRACVTNYRTQPEQIEDLLEELLLASS
jgi:aromatic-L-amino-acid/L-tryptophan decarboxylase